jgi:hypothetical protein
VNQINALWKLYVKRKGKGQIRFDYDFKKRRRSWNGVARYEC